MCLYEGSAAEGRFALRLPEVVPICAALCANLFSLLWSAAVRFADSGGRTLHRNSTPLCLPPNPHRSRRLALLDVARIHCKIVSDPDPFRSHLHHRLVERSFRHPLKPTRRTPLILLRPANQSMLHRVRMHIIQSCEIGLLIRNARIPVLKPHFSRRRFIQPIYFLRRRGVQVPDKSPQPRGSRRRRRDEMIVIWKDCPRFELPLIALR